MTKQATSIRLSAEAEQNIKTIREKYAYLTDKTAAIEFAVWAVAHSHIEIIGRGMLPESAPAARLTRRAAKAREQKR